MAIDSEYVARNIPEDTILNAGIVGGAFVGFAIAATAAALVFAFAQIEINTREMARYYVARRRSEAAIQRAMNQAPVS